LMIVHTCSEEMRWSIATLIASGGWAADITVEFCSYGRNRHGLSHPRISCQA
jgi:hypothetical protein